MKTLEEIAHGAALEMAHRCGVEQAYIDMAEVIIRQAIRDGIKAEPKGMMSGGVRKMGKANKKNPNRFYVSE